MPQAGKTPLVTAYIPGGFDGEFGNRRPVR